MMTENTFDIVILGAGPAGLSAGRALIARNHAQFLILDKTTPWEHTIPCAEGVGKLGFLESGPIKPSWIRTEISSATFHAPNGSEISYTDKHGGYIINRAQMQHDLADEIAAAGATTRFNLTAKAVSPVCNGMRTIQCTDGSTFSAKIIIDASGPTTCFGKPEPIAAKPLDLEPAYFAWVEEVELPPDHIHIFAGQSIAPGGYAWIFPRGAHGANVGIVLGKHYVKRVNIRQLLEQFLATHYPKSLIVRRFAGSIPCGYKRTLPMAIPGLIKAGDAVSTVNPISRAGISEAMLCGSLAGETALRMLAAKNKRGMLLAAKQYEANWNSRRGKRHLKLAKSKNALLSVPDEDYNNGAQALCGIPQVELTMSKIFRASLSRFPRLVWALRHLM